jgi:predicted acylesterase/phospholipase RssA
MGGLLGAAMAMGHDYQYVKSLSASFANKQALFDYTLPLASLMKSAKLTRFCRTVYRDTRIEDLWTPFFCISSNLADGREVIHDHGPLWKVVRSTISLPGVFSPVPTTNGDLLIDGAVLNTFPVDVMQQRLGGKGNIIGVNVSQIPEQFNYYDFGTTLSGWQVLLSRINPFAETIRIPRIAEILLRATDIKSIERLNEARASLEVLVEPNVRSIALLDFKSFEIISELGYEEARKVFIRHGLCADCLANGTGGGTVQLTLDDGAISTALP